MKKKLITMFLVVAMICTLIVGSASAASHTKTHEGYTATARLHWLAAGNGAYATMTYGTNADSIYAYVLYTYMSGSIPVTMPGYKTLYNDDYVYADATGTTNKVAASSTHYVTMNGNTWSTSLAL